MAWLHLLAAVALVQSAAEQMPADPRIRLVPYVRDQVVTLGISQGFASVIELADDERAENVVVGNSSDWQITANRAGDRVIVKPLAGAVATDLIVLTANRRYVFILDPIGETAFVLRFTYPAPTAPIAQTANAPTYRFRGAKSLFPQAMYDDGTRTVIRWNEQTALPAIFAMKDGKAEQLVNGRMVGSDFVIEGAAIRYRFRHGTAVATAIRQTTRPRR